MEELIKQLKEANELLAEATNFMNKVPNRTYGDNYTLCSKIDNFLQKDN